MTRPTSHEAVREAYLAFFEGKGHTRVPSDSLVPSNDPSLLFTGAGMNQFKDLFLGRVALPYTRATSSQKCLRTQDLDVVGTTSYHETFFEMLGNFSFGDYFKREAITWAWEFLRDVLQLDTSRLFVSVYQEDDEAYDAWHRGVGLKPARIRRLGAKDNFWPANAPQDGPNGPCGPCSEIFWDFGGPWPNWQVNHDSPRFAEIWNLVFTQFDRRDGGVLQPLPQKNIDTGSGFERLCMVVQGVESIFMTDVLAPLMARVTDLAGRALAGDDVIKQRRISDHARAAAFCVVDGVLPSNEGRGYVLRKVIRRAVRDGRALGIQGAFLNGLAPVVAQIMRRPYPALAERLEFVQRTIRREEERFLENLDRGEQLVAALVAEVKGAGRAAVSGAEAFTLYDTHGVPLDVSEPLLEAAGLPVDRAGYAAAMARHRDQSRAAKGTSDEIFAARSPLLDLSKHTDFLAWETTESDATVLGLLVDGALTDRATAGAKVEVLLDRSPFYGESGGQVGDTGVLRGPSGEVQVADTQRLGHVLRHLGIVARGTVARGERVLAAVDVARRLRIMQNHTATHLMHAALRAELGGHVRQQGSLVDADRLRFDFSHPEQVDRALLARLEAVVNAHIRANLPRRTEEMSMQAALDMGALAFFGDKYGERVRVCWYGDVSIELCGGTHLPRTGDIGLFVFVGEGAVAAGVRRVEAVTAGAALERLQAGRRHLHDLAGTLKVPVEKISERVDALLTEQRGWQRRETERAGAAAADAARSLLAQARELGGHRVLVAEAAGLTGEQLRTAVDAARAAGVAAVLLASASDGKAALVAASGLPALSAVEWVRDAAPAVKGGGGGKPDAAQAGGKDPAGLPKALDRARAFAAAKLGS